MAAGRDINAAVRDVCLWFPETEEIPSRGSPDFRVRNRTFATYVVNHHGDGRIALWLHAPPGAQAFYTSDDSPHFFVPPYVGPNGWLGVSLDQGLDWQRIAALVREAYEHIAPASLSTQLGDTPTIIPPTRSLDPEDFDPLNHAGAQKKLAKLRKRCLALPEVTEGTTFGDPTFRAGKKSFCTVHRRERRLRFSFWVGADAQTTLIADRRFAIPRYTGHNGWINLDAEGRVNWQEIDALLLGSYRHFALKRMLKALDE